MKVEPTGESTVPADRVAKVIRYRVAVKVLAQAMLSLSETGRITDDMREQLKEISRGR